MREIDGDHSLQHRSTDETAEDAGNSKTLHGADAATSDETDAVDATQDDATENSPDGQSSELEEQIVIALKTVYDPEIPVDIYELGLIYDIDIDESGHVDVAMTLTAPGCPVAGAMPEWVREAVESVTGVDSADVEVVWEPPWTPDMMSMRAKLELNMF